jgi:hypothetical protein
MATICKGHRHEGRPCKGSRITGSIFASLVVTCFREAVSFITQHKVDYWDTISTNKDGCGRAALRA